MARGCGGCATMRLLGHRPFHGGSRRQERLAQPQTRPARTIWRRNILFPMQRSGTRQTLCALVSKRRGEGVGRPVTGAAAPLAAAGFVAAAVSAALAWIAAIGPTTDITGLLVRR